MENFTIVTHPLIKQKLRYLRDKNTPSREFKKLLDEISYLMTFEITRDIEVEEVEIETPLERTVSYEISEHIAVVPILRAGLGMLDGILNLIPTAKVGFIGLYRDEKILQPQEYYCKLPNDIDKRLTILLDPMLATGHSMAYGVELLKNFGVEHIKTVSIVAAPEGVEYMSSKHPDVQMYSAALDKRLNEDGYILPGLGDCGDRLFGTE
jgi:uracil phosphoribosyltransferase